MAQEARKGKSDRHIRIVLTPQIRGDSSARVFVFTCVFQAVCEKEVETAPRKGLGLRRIVS